MRIKVGIDTKYAGLRIVLHCENILICRTSEQLTFFYSKKEKLPSPVIDTKEYVVYIFEKTEEMYATVPGGVPELVKSARLNLGVGGSIGDIVVQTKDKKNAFNYAYSSHLASACKYSHSVPLVTNHLLYSRE